MPQDILLNGQQIFDLLFRFAAVGILSLLFIAVASDTARASRAASLALIACLMGYILLTAPIEDEDYGWLRPPLLLLTNCTIYAMLAVYWEKIHGNSLMGLLPLWAKVLSLVWFLWLSYFFLLKAGRGAFHTWHDGLSLTLLVAIVIDALRDLDDDLVESRRDLRKLTITLTSVYMLALTLVEIFFRPLKDDPIFSLSNALLMLLCCGFFAYRALRWSYFLAPQDSAIDVQPPADAECDVDANEARLKDLMAEGAYTQNGLTIAKLAKQMGMPEHQLRFLINRQLGFENFSQFLNSYRIPEVCRKLKAPEHAETPILTLALETGYNSIATFNRAFKAHRGVTPSQYRQKLTE